MAMHKLSAIGNLLTTTYILSLAVAVTYTIGCVVISLDSCCKIKNFLHVFQRFTKICTRKNFPLCGRCQGLEIPTCGSVSTIILSHAPTLTHKDILRMQAKISLGALYRPCPAFVTTPIQCLNKVHSLAIQPGACVVRGCRLQVAECMLVCVPCLLNSCSGRGGEAKSFHTAKSNGCSFFLLLTGS